MSTKEIKLPSWFRGELYKEGRTVQEMHGGYNHTCVTDLRKGLDWFKKHNAEAYMVLLD
jgi:hypothetical protein